MPKLSKIELDKISGIIERKKRVCEKVKAILHPIYEDNKYMCKGEPETRTKNIESVIYKMRSAKACNVNDVEKYVRDIAGARIICCTKDEIPKIEKYIRSHPDIKACKVIKEWDKGADDLGYRAHHLEVEVAISYKNRAVQDICEIQIRTLATDLWAILSHRDFYKSPCKPAPLIIDDMVALSSLMMAVDNYAVTLKQRRKEESDKLPQEKTKVRKDMLIPENIQQLAAKMYRKNINYEDAYAQVQYALQNGVTSLKTYKMLVEPRSEYQKAVLTIFNKCNIKPDIKSLLREPIFLKSVGIIQGKKILLSKVKDKKISLASDYGQKPAGDWKSKK